MCVYIIYIYIYIYICIGSFHAVLRHGMLYACPISPDAPPYERGGELAELLQASCFNDCRLLELLHIRTIAYLSYCRLLELYLVC